MDGALTVDVISDVVCPWCFIGKRRLEAALAVLRERDPALAVQVRWHPFQLNPELPAEGVDRKAYLEAKFGGPARAAQIYERVRAAGRTADIDFDFEAIARQPNTLDAHRLVAWAQARPEGDPQARPEGDPQARPEGDPQALMEGMFRAYFLEGRPVGDHDELARIAAAAGYDPDDARAFVASDALRMDVMAAEARAREMGVSGVPFFIFDGKTALSGAHEPATMLDAIAQARAAIPANGGNA